MHFSFSFAQYRTKIVADPDLLNIPLLDTCHENTSLGLPGIAGLIGLTTRVCNAFKAYCCVFNFFMAGCEMKMLILSH